MPKEKEQMEREVSKRADSQQKQLQQFIHKFEQKIESCAKPCSCASLLNDIKDVAKSFEQ